MMMVVSESPAGENDSLKQHQNNVSQLHFSGNFIGQATSLLKQTNEDLLWRDVPWMLKQVEIAPCAPEYSFVKLGRVAIVTGVAISTIADAYIYMKEAWWKDMSRTFHFSGKSDYQYALNMDKVGHFFASNLLSDGFGASLRWAGVDYQRSLLCGAALGSFVEFVQEIVDGFAPWWGFSLGDMGSNVVGAFYPAVQSWIPVLKNFTFKGSYWPTKDSYPKRVAASRNQQFVFLDDYEGQTIWVSVNVRNFLPKEVRSNWPPFLNIAAGFTVENRDLMGAGNWVVLLAPDIQLSRLFPAESEFWKTVLHFTDYFHVPTPAVRVTHGVVWYGLYLSSSR
jgi:hypothetical protein